MACCPSSAAGRRIHSRWWRRATSVTSLPTRCSPAATQWIELAGPKEYSYADAAAAASKVLERPVKATPVPLDATVPTLTKLGFSENVAGLYREMIAAFGGGLGHEGKGRSLRGKVPLEDVLRAGLT